jgi:imidazolonepropionase
VAATRHAAEDELFKQAYLRLRQLINNGTCTIETKSGYGLDAPSELKLLRVNRRLREASPGLVLSTYLGAHLVPAEYRDNRDGYIDLVIKQLREVAQAGLADFYDIFVDPLAFTLEEAQRIVATGAETQLGLKLHADEFGDDGTAAWGVAAGALSCDHLGGIGDAGIAALAASNTVATLLPATMFFSGHGVYAPARRMIEAGCAIALATDLNPGSSLVYSLPLTMTLAVLEMALSAEECIVAATINAAHALGIAGRTGSLEEGKRADAIILDVEHYEELPYQVGRDLVRDVIIGGKLVKRDGRLLLSAK